METNNDQTSTAAANGTTVGAFTGLVTTVAKLPISAYIKAGVFTGLAVFTAFVMIRRYLENRKVMKAVEETCAFGNDVLSPADYAMRDNYAGDPTIFDRMDLTAQRVARDCDVNDGRRPNHNYAARRSTPKKGKRKKLNAKMLRGVMDRMCDLDDDFVHPDLLEYGRKNRITDPKLIKARRAEVDEAAARMGLYADTRDDDIPMEIREKYTGILF